jgi:SAM-dependent methyltransferase
MPFADASFDAVISNAMLEHDQKFWLTLEEVRRVTRKGGLVYFGVPGYASSSSTRHRRIWRIEQRLMRSRNPLIRSVGQSKALDRMCGTLVFPFHPDPSDYYRFSEVAVREVVLFGFEVLDIQSVFAPPRILAVGRKL